MSIFSDDGHDKRALEILGSFLSTVTGVPSARDHRLLMEKVKMLRLESKGIEQLIEEQNSDNHHILETFHFIEKSVTTLDNGLKQISKKVSENTGDIAQLMAVMNIYTHTDSELTQIDDIIVIMQQIIALSNAGRLSIHTIKVPKLESIIDKI